MDDFKKYKNKLLKCYELIDKITSLLATFEVLINLSLSDDSVIDAKEFHKSQTLYLQVMADVRNLDRKMKVQTEENFQETVLDEIKNNLMRVCYYMLSQMIFIRHILFIYLMTNTKRKYISML